VTFPVYSDNPGKTVVLSLKKSLLLLLTPIFMLASAGAANAAEVLHLTQKAEISGSFELFISNSALKATNQKTGIIMYSQAPQWQLLLCNTHRQVFAKMPPGKFTGRMAQAITTFDTETLDNLNWKVAGKGNILGLPITSLSVTVRESQFREEPDPRRSNRLWTVEYSEFIQQGVPNTICHALQRLYGVPLTKGKGIPIRVAYLDYNREKTTALETFKCQHLKLDLSYSVPSTYKKVTTEMDVFATPSNNSGLEFFRQ
jgi:hypothetical protein